MIRSTAAPTVEITFEGPCPGRTQGIVESVVLSELPPESHRPATTVAHLAGCKRCRSFADNLRLEKRMLRDLAPFDRRATALPPPDSFDQFKRWLEQHVTERNQRALADALHRLAQRILWLDPEVANTDGATRSREPNETVALFVRDVSSFLGPSSRDNRQNITDGRLEKRECADARSHVNHELRRLLLNCTNSQRLGLSATRRSLVTRVCRLSHVIHGHPHAPSLLVQAYLEWFYGDERLVPSIFDNAVRFADTSLSRACGLLNIAVLNVDRCEAAAGLRSIRASLDVLPSLSTSLENGAIWNLLIGSSALGRSLLDARFRLVAPDGSVRSWELAPLRRQLSRVAELYQLSGLNVARAFEQIADRNASLRPTSKPYMRLKDRQR